MTAKLRYSTEYDPPAPVVPVRLGSPSGGAGALVVALIDTGADVTVMPLAVVQNLALPVVATTRIAGVVGATRANVHAGILEVAGTSKMIELVALGAEGILGRDVTNHWVLSLDGPRRALEIRVSRGRSRTARSEPPTKKIPRR